MVSTVTSILDSNMRVTLLCVGKTSDKYLLEGIAIFTKRLSHYCTFNIQIVKDVKATRDKAALMDSEGRSMMKALKDEDTVILLDEIGKPYTSTGFASYIERHMVQSTRHLVFVIGGAYGFADVVRQRANGTMSVSTMTFSHQMIRLFFAEQLYRAFTIIRNEKYHNP